MKPGYNTNPMYISEMKEKYVWPIIDDDINFNHMKNSTKVH